MSYYIAKEVEGKFDDIVSSITGALKEEGFGILCDIDVRATLKAKLNKDFRPYRILGACNPPFAYQALEAEDKIGLLLPCNVIVQQKDNGKVEVAVIDPVEAMNVVDNPSLENVAKQVREKLVRALEKL